MPAYYRMLKILMLLLIQLTRLQPSGIATQGLSLYLPFQKGAFWSYVEPGTSDAGWVSLRVLGRQQRGKLDCYTVEISNDSIAGPLKRTASVCLSTAGHSLGVAKDQLTEYDPPLPILKQPLQPGQTWEWEGKQIWRPEAGQKVESVTKYKFRIEREVGVQVIAGGFKALEITIRKDGLPADTAVRYWLAKDVGIVKATGFGLLLGVHGQLKDYSLPRSQQEQTR